MNPFTIKRKIHGIIVHLESESYRLVLQPDSHSVTLENTPRLDTPLATPGFDRASDDPKLLGRLIYPAQEVLTAGGSVRCICQFVIIDDYFEWHLRLVEIRAARDCNHARTVRVLNVSCSRRELEVNGTVPSIIRCGIVCGDGSGVTQS